MTWKSGVNDKTVHMLALESEVKTDITDLFTIHVSSQPVCPHVNTYAFAVCVCEHLLDVFSFLVLFAVVLLLAQCEELLLLLFLQLCEPLAALLIQLTQLLVQGRQRVFGPTAERDTHTHTKGTSAK